jgi:hypothetical protein
MARLPMQIGDSVRRLAGPAFGDEEGCAARLRATRVLARAACTRAKSLAAIRSAASTTRKATTSSPSTTSLLMAQSDSLGIAEQDDASDGAVDVRADGGVIAIAPSLAREDALSKRKAAKKDQPRRTPLTARGSATWPDVRRRLADAPRPHWSLSRARDSRSLWRRRDRLVGAPCRRIHGPGARRAECRLHMQSRFDPSGADSSVCSSEA